MHDIPLSARATHPARSGRIREPPWGAGRTYIFGYGSLIQRASRVPAGEFQGDPSVDVAGEPAPTIAALPRVRSFPQPNRGAPFNGALRVHSPSRPHASGEGSCRSPARPAYAIIRFAIEWKRYDTRTAARAPGGFSRRSFTASGLSRQRVPVCGAPPRRETLVSPGGRQEQRQGDLSPCHSQLIAQWGACGKAPVVAQNRRPRPQPAGRRARRGGRDDVESVVGAAVRSWALGAVVRVCAPPDRAAHPADSSEEEQQRMTTRSTRSSTALEAPVMRSAAPVQGSTAASEASR